MKLYMSLLVCERQLCTYHILGGDEATSLCAVEAIWQYHTLVRRSTTLQEKKRLTGTLKDEM